LRPQKFALAIFVILFAGFVSADIELESNKSYFVEGDNASFNFTGTEGNYTLYLEASRGNRKLTDFTVNSSESSKGKIIDYTWRDGSTNSRVNVFAGNSSGNNTAYSDEFFLGTGEPVFNDVSVRPEIPNVKDYAIINVRGIDPDYDIENVFIETKEGNDTVRYDMVDQNESEPYFEFEKGLELFEEGVKDYNISVRTSESLKSFTSSFEVFPEGQTGDETDIYANVGGECGIRTNPFRPPGGGVVSVNGSSPFLVGWDDKSYAAEIRYKLNVTYENNYTSANDSYESLLDGEPGEYMNMSYGIREPDENPVLGPTNETVLEYNKTSRFGWYRGRMEVNGTCYRQRVSDSYYEGNDITRDEYPQFVEAEVTSDGDANFTANFTGDFKVIRPGGGKGEGDPTDNSSVPGESDEVGEQEGEQVEGDNDNPGITPEPEPEPVPEPVPEPEPEPTPVLSVNIQETEDTYTVSRGRYSPVELSVSNLGESALSNLELDPAIEEMEGWEKRPASIANLSSGGEVNRTIFLRPPEDIEEGRYSLPVYSRDVANDRDLDVRYIDVKVQKTNFSSSLEIAEIPETVSVQRGSSISIPVLLNNTGQTNISDFNLRVQNVGSCGEAFTRSNLSLGVNSTSSVNLGLNASDSIRSCNTTVIVSTSEGAYTFSDLSVEVTPEEGFVPPEFRVPLIAILWTVGLIIYAVAQRRMGLDSVLVKGPFVIMVAGEVLIMLYLAVQYYGIVPEGVLPF